MNSAVPPDNELLSSLLIEWEDSFQRGHDVPAEELARNHPELIPALSRAIAALKQVAWLQDPLDGEPSPPVSDARTPKAGPTLAGRYRLDVLVAEGGFGQVWRGYDTELQRSVAIKIPKPGRLLSRNAFLAEARRVARLTHDGIVPVYDCGSEGDSCFIISEYVDGGTLADRIAAKPGPTAEEVVRWVSDVADALEFAHLSGVIHRDVKPANILIDQHGRAKLADFGIAASASTAGDRSPSLGTLRYMPPESLAGRQSDHRGDIFSLGIVLHEALTGSVPYSSDDAVGLRREILAGRPPCSRAMPPELLAVCRRALNGDPHLRHTSAAAFAADARRAIGRSGTRRYRPVTAVGFAGLLVVATGIGLRHSLMQPARHSIAPPETVVAPPRDPSGPSPGRVDLVGFDGRTALQGEMPSAWIRPGTFAEITSAGFVVFPRLPESAYVLEIDLTFRTAKGRIDVACGERRAGHNLALGGLWPQDSEQTSVPCRLFRNEGFCVRWWDETFFPVDERLRLRLVVADDHRALMHRGVTVLRADGDTAECALRIDATDDANVTIHRLVCRQVTLDDCRQAGVPFPRRQIGCDVEGTRRRLETRHPPGPADAPAEGSSFVVADLGMPLRWVEPTEYVMGTDVAPWEVAGLGHEAVRLTRGYWIGAYEVSQEQWTKVLGSNPSRVTGSPFLPVNNISWSEARAFCEALTKRERAGNRCPNGYEYRLPTEAEWEWACRAGTDLAAPVPPSELALPGGASGGLVEIGGTPANAWGLHEMIGNVEEWCLDAWQAYPATSTEPTIDRYCRGEPGIGEFSVRGGGFWLTEAAATSFGRTRRQDVAGGFRGCRVVLGPVRPR